MSPQLPEYVTKPLLTRVMEDSLDSDYALVAERGAGSGKRSHFAVVAVLLFGLLVGVAVMQTTREADLDSASREVLLDQIAERRARLAGQQGDLDALRQDITRLSVQVNALQTSTRDLTRRVDKLGKDTGFAAVRGPGLRLTVTDGPGSDPALHVRAADLAILVDALYNAGATGISINDQRLTAMSSLHDSGSAIGIDATSLRSPYVVRALGDPRTLGPGLQESTHGLRWANLVAQLGFGYDVVEERRMTLPAAVLPPLRAATTVLRARKASVSQ
ncbi:MAG: DUF881 domain-containing protein [Nocardioides sp.]